MVEQIEIQWEVFRVLMLGKQHALVHIRPLAGLSSTNHRLFSVEMPSGLEWVGAFLVFEDTGTRIPVVEDHQVFVPKDASHTSLFLLVDSGPEPRGEFSLVVQEASSSTLDGPTRDPIQARVNLEQAWPSIPSDLEEHHKTLKRLVRDGGGTVEERRAYRSATIRALDSSEPVLSRFRERLSAPLVLASLPRDMQPLAHAKAVLELSNSADKGDLNAFRAVLENVPLAIQLNPDIRALTERVRSLSETPDTADEDRMSRIHRAMSQGKFKEAISISRHIPPDRKLFATAQRCRAEALLGMAWRSLDAGLVSEAGQLVQEDWVSTVLGDGHKGLKSFLEELNLRSQDRGEQ